MRLRILIVTSCVLLMLISSWPVSAGQCYECKYIWVYWYYICEQDLCIGKDKYCTLTIGNKACYFTQPYSNCDRTGEPDCEEGPDEPTIAGGEIVNTCNPGDIDSKPLEFLMTSASDDGQIDSASVMIDPWLSTFSP